MRHPKLTFMQAAEMRCEPPSAVRAAHIVSVADGFQLLAKLVNESGDWTLTSPGGIADTFPDLGRLQAFATTVLGGQPLPVVVQPANQSPVQHPIA